MKPDLTPVPDERLVTGFSPMNWARKPPQFKTYPGLPVQPLPSDIVGGPPGGLDVNTLARLLFLSAGVVRSLEVGGRPMWFRSVGSAGNLHPVEVYVVTGDLHGLKAGIYHYSPVEHGLVWLGPVPNSTPPALVLTGVPWRTAWKYRERGFRHLFWDAGTMVAHLLAVAGEAGLYPSVELGFVDSQVAALVGAGLPDEVPLAVVRLEPGSLPPPDPGPDKAPAGFLYEDATEFPLITDTWLAGVLNDCDDVDAWRQAAQSADARHVAAAVAFNPPEPLDDVIRRRGSTRVFTRDAVAPSHLLTGGLGWAAGAVPGDFVRDGSTLLDHLVAVMAVDGLEPGSYRHVAGGPEELRNVDVTELRAAAGHLCLDQDLGGTGAFTVFHCADVDGVTESLGARGYRAAQLEAGVVSGRLHLAAVALGWGATGITFNDDEVSEFFETHRQPMLATAVGMPAYRSRPGGLPGRTVQMRKS